MKQALVSISCITYNHQDYIEECLNGFFMQQCNFDVELVISDDKSTDDTVKVIERCLYRKPDNFTIRFTAHETNMGASPNFVWCMEQCTGKYIALCEGDDYWTDPHKLQKQVDFLEANEEYVVCAHETKIKYENTENPEILFRDFSSNAFKGCYKSDYNLVDTFYGIIYHTSSVLFKNDLINYSDFNLFKGIPSGDNILMSLTAQFGKIHVLDEVMSIYRVNDYGITNQIPEFQNTLKWLDTKISLYSKLNEYFNYQYDKILKKRVEYYKNTKLSFQVNKWRGNMSLLGLYKLYALEGFLRVNKNIVERAIQKISKI